MLQMCYGVTVEGRIRWEGVGLLYAVVIWIVSTLQLWTVVEWSFRQMQWLHSFREFSCLTNIVPLEPPKEAGLGLSV